MGEYPGVRWRGARETIPKEASMWLAATHDLESALPGEWAALVVVAVVVVAVVGGVVLAVTCAMHERVLARRRRGRAMRAGVGAGRRGGGRPA